MSDVIPDTCFRGLRSSKWKKATGLISAEAFLPDERTELVRAKQGKTPGLETSVNWEDDSDALRVTRDDKVNATHGVARVHARRALEDIAIVDRRSDVCCERDALAGNRYHGNLVFPPGKPKHEYLALATVFAALARSVD